MTKIEVNIMGQESLFGIVFPMKTGVIWTSQTEGVMCNHPELEGIFIPLPGQVHQPDVMCDISLYGWGGKTVSFKAEIQQFLTDNKFTELFEPVSPLTIARMANKNPGMTRGGEAWVPVRVKKIKKDNWTWYDLLHPFENKIGFITYYNSD